MAERKALVLVGGDTKQLPTGDTLALDQIDVADLIILRERTAHPSPLTTPNRAQIYYMNDGNVYIMKPDGFKVKLTP